ncbi:hypothetical protein BG006_003695 [Podila minutissima]|uniref:Uncharacterized protein n=1 Tax=Podila minutissima TaxID=64525 RepID=A0A9P5SLX0_9FUNG|nr:hypothetical protein BG006_003695 [Podila minutissima]
MVEPRRLLRFIVETVEMKVKDVAMKPGTLSNELKREKNALLKNKHCIRSLTVDAEHVESICDLSAFTTLQELITWLVPEDHNKNDFARCILHACHSRTIQELHIYERPSSRAKNYTTTTITTVIPRYTDFARKLDQPLDAHGVFALQKLHLRSYAFNNFHLPLLNASSEVQHVTVSRFAGLELETLASHASLRWLDFRHIRNGALDCATELGRFESNLAALEVLGMHRDSAMNKDIVAVLNIFLSLKKVDFGDVKMYLRGGRQGGEGDALDLDHESCVQSLGDLYSLATIAQDWDPVQKRRPTGDMADWWKHWNRAVTFMKAVREEYLKQRRIQSCQRSIRMRLMYPFRAFMSRNETEEYRRLRNGWGITLTDAYYMAQAIEKEVEQEKEEIKREQNADMGVDSEEDRRRKIGAPGAI